MKIDTDKLRRILALYRKEGGLDNAAFTKLRDVAEIERLAVNISTDLQPWIERRKEQMTWADAVEYLGISKRALSYHVGKNIKQQPGGRFLKEDLDQFLLQRKIDKAEERWASMKERFKAEKQPPSEAEWAEHQRQIIRDEIQRLREAYATGKEY